MNYKVTFNDASVVDVVSATSIHTLDSFLAFQRDGVVIAMFSVYTVKQVQAQE